MFTGQGAQWPGMGRELIENYPVYKTSLVDSAATLKEFDTSWDLLSAYTCFEPPKITQSCCYSAGDVTDHYQKTS